MCLSDGYEIWKIMQRQQCIKKVRVCVKTIYIKVKQAKFSRDVIVRRRSSGLTSGVGGDVVDTRSVSIRSTSGKSIDSEIVKNVKV